MRVKDYRLRTCRNRCHDRCQLTNRNDEELSDLHSLQVCHSVVFSTFSFLSFTVLLAYTAPWQNKDVYFVEIRIIELFCWFKELFLSLFHFGKARGNYVFVAVVIVIYSCRNSTLNDRGFCLNSLFVQSN